MQRYTIKYPPRVKLRSDNERKYYSRWHKKEVMNKKLACSRGWVYSTIILSWHGEINRMMRDIFKSLTNKCIIKKNIYI